MTGTPLGTSGKILVADVGDGVARVTLNRPEKRNALDQEARHELLAAFASLEGRAKVIVLTGAGGTFCSGMDLTQIADGSQGGQDELNRSWLQVQEAIRRHPAVFIAHGGDY